MIKDVETYKLTLDIADDYYSASLSVEYREDFEGAIYDEVLAFLEEGNVVFGIDKTTLKTLCNSKNEFYNQVVAVGTPHINGQDSNVIEQIDFDQKAKPTIDDNGQVDFKEMNFVNTVNEGDVLVVKVPATEAVPGMTVTGKSINGKNGKDKKIQFGENTILSENGLTLVASAVGIPKKYNNRIVVSKLIEVREVGPETGNIYFSGDVHVKENVLDGYTIHCDGDLIVGGVVEGSYIKVKGDLVVGKGIVGHGRSDIVVNGNLTAKFLENANVYAKGQIETGEIINSSVLCDSQISVLGKKGLIIGGEITSKYIIEANRIGSKLGVLTSINLGVDVRTIRELKELKEIVQELKIVEERLAKTIPTLRQMLEKDPDNEALQTKLRQYMDSLLSTQIDLEEKNERLEKILEALKKVEKGQIKINIVYPDTVVKIGNASYFIDQALKECIITRSNDKVIAIGF